jgi:hypothetical protein
MVVRESGTRGEGEASGFETGEELLGASDAAEGGDRAGDFWDFHLSVQAPDGAMPAPNLQRNTECRIIGWNGKNGGAANGLQGFAKIAGREKAIVPVAPIEQKNLLIASQLTMLEAVVENVDSRLVLVRGCVRVGFGKLTSFESLPRNVDGETGFAGNEERLVAEVVDGAVGADAGGESALATVAAGENIDMNAPLGERLSKRDGERSLARAAGGEISDADDGITEAADRFEAGSEAELAGTKRKAIERNQREQHGARLLAHAGSLLVGLAWINCCSASRQRAVAPACWSKT